MDFPWVYGISAMIIAYLCGSIPTSVWWGKAFYKVDVREHGSKNAGATNTFRVLGPKAGVPVLLIDILKGFLPVRILPNFSELQVDKGPWMWLRVALVIAAVVGHLYPVFAGFKGGKGVATSLGGVLAVHPGAAAVCVLVFALIFTWYGYKFVQFGWNQTSELADLPMAWIFVAWPLTGVTWLLFGFERLRRELRRAVNGPLPGEDKPIERDLGKGSLI